MTALIRTVMQLLIARLLATPVGGWAYPVFEATGVTAERLADIATVFVLGLGVAAARFVRSTGWGAYVVAYANMILSLGRSAGGPAYVGKHEG